MRRLPPCVLARRASWWSWPGTAGSSPRGVGAWMAVFADGSQAGTIGGGKIELFALDEARELLSAGQSRLVRYTMAARTPIPA